MQELKWLEVLPDHSLDAGIELLRELGWNPFGVLLVHQKWLCSPRM